MRLPIPPPDRMINYFFLGIVYGIPRDVYATSKKIQSVYSSYPHTFNFFLTFFCSQDTIRTCKKDLFSFASNRTRYSILPILPPDCILVVERGLEPTTNSIRGVPLSSLLCK